jgi:hypothetical protein
VLAAPLEGERDFVRDANHELRKSLTPLTARVQSALRNAPLRSTRPSLREVQTDLYRLNRQAE